MGLISWIPVYGWVALIGWTLACLDNLRAGRREMAPARLGYFGRGLRLFLVLIVYAGVVGLVGGGLVGAGSAFTSAGGRSDSLPTSIEGLILMSLGAALMLFGLVLLYLLAPAIVLATERDGIAGGLNITRVFAIVRSDPRQAIIAGLMTVIAYVIGGLGAALCVIGSVLTVAYGQAVFAAVVDGYEKTLEPVRPRAPAV